MENSVHLDSSMLIYAEYDHDNKILIIEFKNNSEYKYIDVPVEIFDGLANASSAGKYFNSNIKDVYEFES